MTHQYVITTFDTGDCKKNMWTTRGPYGDPLGPQDFLEIWALMTLVQNGPVLFFEHIPHDDWNRPNISGRTATYRIVLHIITVVLLQ